jgi:hypothetical protein
VAGPPRPHPVSGRGRRGRPGPAANRAARGGKGGRGVAVARRPRGGAGERGERASAATPGRRAEPVGPSATARLCSPGDGRGRAASWPTACEARRPDRSRADSGTSTGGLLAVTVSRCVQQPRSPGVHRGTCAGGAGWAMRSTTVWSRPLPRVHVVPALSGSSGRVASPPAHCQPCGRGPVALVGRITLRASWHWIRPMITTTL